MPPVWLRTTRHSNEIDPLDRQVQIDYGVLSAMSLYDRQLYPDVNPFVGPILCRNLLKFGLR